MTLDFYKYQGTGNDFIMVDDRLEEFPKSNTDLVAFLCSRKFGIGADGLILLQKDPESDFKMVYFNADGKEGSMCGNGGRCIVAFAHNLGLVGNEVRFNAVDGLHYADISGELVSLQMCDVDDIKVKPNSVFLNTGSPHHVQIVDNVDSFNVDKEGKKLRYGLYGETGSNINFVKKEKIDAFTVRTYERGVEAETLSCGTGVTAVAIAMHYTGVTDSQTVNIKTHGGNLQVSFENNGGSYSSINLMGPAKMVFKGVITW
ncbi:MAG: diaminopimelate epimerase [Flavobacteriaceae bacterium]